MKHNLKDLNNKRKNHENIQNGQIPSDTNTFIATEAHNGSNGSLDKNSPYMCAPMTPTKGSVGSPLGVKENFFPEKLFPLERMNESNTNFYYRCSLLARGNEINRPHFPTASTEP